MRLVAVYGYLAVLVVVGLESTGVPLPGETMLLTAAIYAGTTHQLSIVGVITAAAAGAILGDNLGFVIGYWGGYRFLRRFGRYIRLNQPRLRLGRYLFRRHGGKVVFFGRFVSVLRIYAAFLAGTNHMPWARFLAFNAAGGIIWATLYGTGAYVLGNAIQNLSRRATIAFGVLALIAILLLLGFLRRNEARLQAEADRTLYAEGT